MLQIVVASFLLQLPSVVVFFSVLQVQDLSNMQQPTYISYYHVEKLMAMSHS